MYQILKIKRNIHIEFRFLKIFIKNSLPWLDYITCKQTTLIRWKITSSFLPCHNGIPQWVDLLVAILCSMLWNEAPHAAVVFTLSSHMRWAQDLLRHSQHGYIIPLGKSFFCVLCFEMKLLLRWSCCSLYYHIWDELRSLKISYGTINTVY